MDKLLKIKTIGYSFLTDIALVLLVATAVVLPAAASLVLPIAIVLDQLATTTPVLPVAMG